MRLSRVGQGEVLPRIEEVSDAGNGFNLVVVDECWGIYEVTCEEIEGMDDVIFRCEGRLDQSIMPELGGVG